MEVEYTEVDWKGNDRQESQTIARFLYDELLYKERYNTNRDKVHLEEQPKVVLEAVGRLVEKLLDKGVFNLEDLKYIADCDWGRKAESLKLKKEE